MADRNKDNREPKALSPTPLRDWVARQPAVRRAAFVGLFEILIACGGRASFAEAGGIPATQQLFFALAAGVLLGSRLGTISAMAYLLAASVSGSLWPVGFGTAALVGPLSGFLWSLPLSAYLAGVFVERCRAESAAHFAVGAFAAVAAFDGIGSLRLLAAHGLDTEQGLGAASGLAVGQHLAQSALAAWMGASASAAIQSTERK